MFEIYFISLKIGNNISKTYTLFSVSIEIEWSRFLSVLVNTIKGLVIPSLKKSLIVFDP
jgi:hypothetical protein